MKDNEDSSFSIEISSVPDRENLVAEIWLDRELLAELRHEHGRLKVQIYPPAVGRQWDVPYEDFIGTLQRARTKLNSST